MAEEYKDKRVFFPQGKQGAFLRQIRNRMPLKRIAEICGVSERTIRDWQREKFSMRCGCLLTLCNVHSIPFPSDVTLQDRFWYVHQGASEGGKATMRKYGRVGGNPRRRMRKWREWWNRDGKNKISFSRKKIRAPRRSKELAEFVGIMLGDGGVSEYQVCITLHMYDDKTYVKFISNLIHTLFHVPVSTYDRQDYSVTTLVVSRIELVQLCTQILGLKKGNKIRQHADIPEWIQRNKEYAVACLRGLMDTDGSVFIHRYKVNGKLYSYKKIAFTSYSEPLRRSVLEILRMIGINARLDNHHNVRIESKHDVKAYMQLVHSHNPKHLKRYAK